MQVGDIVKSFLTEQIGIIIRVGEPAYGCPSALRVMWTTQGLSLFRPGTKEWCGESSLELLTSS